MHKWFLFLLTWALACLCYGDPLPASEAFQIQTKSIDPNTFVINWLVKPGYFLYRDRIKVSEQTDSNSHLGIIRFPETLIKTDKQGHSYTVYRDKLALPVAILGEQPGESLINVEYQGCADDGFCYPPETKKIKLTIDNKLALSGASLEAPAEVVAASAQPAPTPSSSSSQNVEEVFTQHHWAVAILIFFGFGLLLSFTPCVLPMVPVLSGIIVGHGHNLSTRKAFFLSLSYVLSMSLTYALAGAIIAILGSNLQMAMQNPWVIAVFSLIFVLLALSMFGLYELRLPVSWQAKLASASRSHSTGHYLGAAIMGCLSTLILSPCVTAPLIGALSYIAKEGNIALGGFALFFLGLGMGVPLLLIGTSAGKLLPKAGKWMNLVKAFFGVLLLAVAIFLLDRVVPGPLVMGLWAALLIFSGIFCGALTHSRSNYEKFRQGLGLILLIYGLLILIGASMGNQNPFQPLANMHNIITTNQSSQDTTQKSVKTVKALNSALKNVKGKPVLLDFYADWCSSCKLMEATVFKNPMVKRALEDFAVIKVDVTDNSNENKTLLNQFHVIAPPTFIFLNKQGKELPNLRLVGELSSQDFLNQLKLALVLNAEPQNAFAKSD